MSDSTEDHGKAIVVATRGHVWVGDAVTGDRFTTIKGGRVIRQWGTSEGLNQLAAQGPQERTKLDAPADLKVLNSAIIAVIPCTGDLSKWNA
jgi:hypothetical protein